MANYNDGKWHILILTRINHLFSFLVLLRPRPRFSLDPQPCSVANTKGLLVKMFWAFTKVQHLRVSQLLPSILHITAWEFYQKNHYSLSMFAFFALTLFSSRNSEEETRRNCNIRDVEFSDLQSNLIRKHFWHNRHNYANTVQLSRCYQLIVFKESNYSHIFSSNWEISVFDHTQQ